MPSVNARTSVGLDSPGTGFSKAALTYGRSDRQQVRRPLPGGSRSPARCHRRVFNHLRASSVRFVAHVLPKRVSVLPMKLDIDEEDRPDHASGCRATLPPVNRCGSAWGPAEGSLRSAWPNCGPESLSLADRSKCTAALRSRGCIPAEARSRSEK